MNWRRARELSEDWSSYTQRFLTGNTLCIWLDHLPFLRGPINKYCPADHVFNRQQTPLMRIPRIVAIVAQHKQLSFRDNPVPIICRRTGNIRFRQRNTTDRDNAIVDGDRFTRQTDYSFDQVLLRVDREDKNDDVAAPG